MTRYYARIKVSDEVWIGHIDPISLCDSKKKPPRKGAMLLDVAFDTAEDLIKWADSYSGYQMEKVKLVVKEFLKKQNIVQE